MEKQLYLFFFLGLLSCTPSKKAKEDHQIIEVQKTAESLIIDGRGTENSWNKTQWLLLDQNWLGGAYEHDDFNGRYKLLWNEAALYILMEVVDDVLYDNHKDPFKLWWNDDSIQLFIDEDNSGGLHQYDHNAFAYNIALDGNVVDFDLGKEPKLYNENVTSAKITEENLTTWEIKIKLYRMDYQDGVENGSVVLSKEKKIGFALAYCDNDGSTERENFIGSVFVPGEDKNVAWINADVFGTLVLKD